MWAVKKASFAEEVRLNHEVKGAGKGFEVREQPRMCILGGLSCGCLQREATESNRPGKAVDPPFC